MPEYVEILQRPTSLRNSTSDIADWAYYFVGADREAASADRAAYARLKLPTAILWGDKDTVTPVEQAQRPEDAASRRRRLTLLPGLGHIPQIEDPTFFNEALLKAIAKL